jgi:DNA (cytosine-5)-methyltransferase 1
MSKPRLLDLFCGAGGAAMGYARAGFEVVGVDINPQKNYPFEFIQANVLNLGYLLWDSNARPVWYDAIHASPPCQAYSITKHTHGVQHPDLLGPTRELLKATGLPYIIENVVGADMPGAVICCGSWLCAGAADEDWTRLFLKRHRQFESNVPLVASECDCKLLKKLGYKIGGVYGGGSRDRAWAENVRHGGYTPSKAVQEKLMGIDWMTQKELNQAIPPAYTEFIGRQLMKHLGDR